MKNKTLFAVVKEVHDGIPADIGGGSGLAKCYLMACLAHTLNLKTYAEIGVYRGRSLFPVAMAFSMNKGNVYAIDPYCRDASRQHNVDDSIKDLVDQFIENCDYEDVYKSVVLKKEELGLSDTVRMIRETSNDAVNYLIKNNVTIDMIHIDGNHDTVFVRNDYNNYYPLLNDGALIVFDDINWGSVCEVYSKAREENIVVYECETFGVLLKKKKTQENIHKSEALTTELQCLFDKVTDIEKDMACGLPAKPTVKVGVMTFNHEDYITECLENIMCQRGDFTLKLVICDDNSTDKTAEMIERFLQNISAEEKIEIEFVKNEKNLGVIKNFEQLFFKLEGGDYFAFCEGDDYWISPDKIDTQIRFMKENPQCALSFNSIIIFHQNLNKYELFEEQQNLSGNVFKSDELAKSNFIGNLSCNFYDARHIEQFPKAFFDIFCADWLFNLTYSQFGDIGFIRKPMSVYRKHDKGIWSNTDVLEKNSRMLQYIDDYNKAFNFNYDDEFQQYKMKCVNSVRSIEAANPLLSIDLAIIDDVFPHPLSGFRYQEYTSYLEAFQSAKIFSTGLSIKVLGESSLSELFKAYKRKHPNFAHKLFKINQIEGYKIKLLYCVFLGNVAYHLSFIEQNRIPFIFTLYPGGSFGIKNLNSDNMLLRVLKSPCFMKVIVTQQVTYDYLISKNCPKEKIEFIFGVVTPLEKFRTLSEKKKHFGIEKRELDICFVAHKYTKFGQDKGYDIFVSVAKQLCLAHDNINFHIVGPYDNETIDVSVLGERIKFFGPKDPEELQDFFLRMDIILSPNIHGIIYKGSFDGFPTASCTDAGLAEVAIFCTDELQLNQNRFTDGHDIVIIQHFDRDIIDKIEFYYNNPMELKEICENGRKRILELYGYDAQILPRLRLINEELSKPFIYNEIDFVKRDKLYFLRRVIRIIKKICPDCIKVVYRKFRYGPKYKLSMLAKKISIKQ